MQKPIKLSIDCVNKVKVEKLEEFPASIFGEVYRLAHMQVGRIMDMTHALNMNDDAEKFCNGNEMSNVISFVGERGMGKSSAMLSFAYFLKQYPYNLCNLKENTENDFKFKINKKDNEDNDINCKFYILPKIDAAALVNESLFDVVLAKMWTDFSEKAAGAGEDSFSFSHTKESFNSIKDAYTLYYKDEKQNKNLTSVRQLQELSRSLALREQFAKLVESFLDYIVADNNIASKDRFLVIPIDDLDLANDMSLAILEQIRIFLSVPQVIILTTVDIEKLSLAGNKKFSDELIYQKNVGEYEQNLVRQYADRYIAKVLPRNSRIYMPRYGGIEAKNYVLEYKKFVAFLSNRKLDNGKDVGYITYINMITAKYLNLIMRYKDTLSFSAEPIRNIVNKLNELWSICKYYKGNTGTAVLEWLEKESIISGNLMSGQANIDFMRKLRLMAEEDYNKLIIEHFAELNPGTGKNGYGYGNLLCVLLDLENSGIENNEIAKAVIMFYSMQVVKYLSQKQYDEVDSLFIHGDIFSSFFAGKKYLDFQGGRTLDNLLQLTFEYDSGERNVGNIILQNLQHIVDVFKIFLFCNIEFVVRNYNFRVKSSPDSVKEIPGTEKAKEKEQLSIGTLLSFSYVSIDTFFENVICYKDLLKKYLKWIYLQLDKLMEADTSKSEECFNNLFSRIEKDNDEISGIQKMERWKAVYTIENIYDLLPVQDIGVMVGVIKKLSAPGAYWRDISTMMDRLSRAFQQEFDEAEKACMYNEWGYAKYSEKMRALMDIIGLDKVPQRIKDSLVVKGQRTEDTTKLP